MKNLNSLQGFNWVYVGNNDKNLGKVNICGESFWLRECKKVENNIWTGIVDNELLNTDKHNLKFNDVIMFSIDK